MKTTNLMLVCLISSTCLFSTIINVPADQPTIQDGIDASVDADTVLVQPGTYMENICYYGKLITVGSLFLTTQDTAYISQTVIDGDQNYSVVRFAHGEDSTALLIGFVITNGGGDTYGGGISCSDSSPSLENVIISGNSSYYYGGGIYCNGSNPVLENITIAGNSAYLGGGIYCNGSNPILENITIAGNSAYLGGGIYCNGSNPILENITIAGNSAYLGGGIYCLDNSNLNFDSVNRCNIYLNYAEGVGCDLYAYDCPTINVIVDTFTVLQPDDYFTCPIDNFTFDILNAKVEQVDQDLYVSPDGSNDNSGLTAEDPLLTVSFALIKILTNSTNPNTINLSNGVYSPSRTGEMFPLYCRSYISLDGEDETLTILNSEGENEILICVNDNDFSIENLTIHNGTSGINCDNSSPSLLDVTISGNNYHGIYCSDQSNPSLQNVTISGNERGLSCNNSSPNLFNVTISGNNNIGISCSAESI